MNLLIALDRDGCAELFKQVERVTWRWLYERLHRRPPVDISGMPFQGLHRNAHPTLRDRSRAFLGAGVSALGPPRYSETDVRDGTYDA
jgi:hypothetical protein